ncbi:hypothetical protein [Bradyrhizobium stylosanthis]|uniref:UrcA family protein n=1 Tax=Bradyrhizobium stylosanthis TaxID=1803665 RepID=A0A560DJF4_9BRAD|nr:hypothetical protein [Bradyrhizobium stylosanthis]TWA97247.1 hypothetical protein FBZ96_106299 [Bradyrhizobium stylosanthis]
MWSFRGQFPAIAACVSLVFVSTPHAFARGSQGGYDAPWNPEHIDRLPLEVRNAVAHMCRSSARAAHYFATYLENSRIIRLHFEHLHCSEGGGFCRGDTCLHQEYVAQGGQYRLMKSYYGRNDD